MSPPSLCGIIAIACTCLPGTVHAGTDISTPTYRDASARGVVATGAPKDLCITPDSKLVEASAKGTAALVLSVMDYAPPASGGGEITVASIGEDGRAERQITTIGMFPAPHFGSVAHETRKFFLPGRALAGAAIDKPLCFRVELAPGAPAGARGSADVALDTQNLE